MEENNYSRACTETLKIIDLLSLEDYNKIPESVIKTLEANKDKTYNFEYDYTKKIINQNIEDLTFGLIANLFKNYIATNEEKNTIKTIEKKQFIEQEELKIKKYNPDDIFKKTSSSIENLNIDVSENSSNTSLIEYKESFFTKFKHFIFRTLHINN